MASRRTISTAASTARRILSSPAHVPSSTAPPIVRQCAAIVNSSSCTDDIAIDRCAQLQQRRSLVLSAAATGASSPSGDEYVSPYADFFDMIEKGKTSLGTDATKRYEPEPIRYLKCGVRENDLRFRTTAYGRLQLPPYVMPAEYKVTLKVRMDEIPFENDVERDVFLQIVGSRYVAKKDEVRLNSDQFASRIENKRHLVSMLDRIVLSAKRLAKEAEEGKL